MIFLKEALTLSFLSNAMVIIFINVFLRTSEINLFYNLQVFYLHFLEILWLFIFLVLYLYSRYLWGYFYLYADYSSAVKRIAVFLFPISWVCRIVTACLCRLVVCLLVSWVLLLLIRKDFFHKVYRWCSWDSFSFSSSSYSCCPKETEKRGEI